MLAIVMDPDVKKVKKEESLDYVLGYTAGNNVSSRYFRRTTILRLRNTNVTLN